MTAHSHTTYVEGCYRCELGRDEAEPVTDQHGVADEDVQIANDALKLIHARPQAIRAALEAVYPRWRERENKLLRLADEIACPACGENVRFGREVADHLRRTDGINDAFVVEVQRADRAEAMLDAARKLHMGHDVFGDDILFCETCNRRWPCYTARALGMVTDG